MTTQPLPYETLTPDVVQDAIASVGLIGDGRLLPLGSYENRVYLLPLEEGEPIVAKFYRPGRWTTTQIAEEHAFAAELVGAEIPVVAPLALGGRTLHSFGGFEFAIYPRRGGRPPELDSPEVLEWLGRFIGRIHAIGRTRPFRARPTLDVDTFGREPREWLSGSDMLPLETRRAWLSQADEAIDLAAAAFNTVGDITPLRLHGDCHPGNVLWRPASGNDPGGPHFVDLDDARMGPAVQDLWMLLSGDRHDRTVALSDLLAGYEDFCEFDRRELALIEPLRTLRLIHYSAWLARRWDDPAFPAAFPWFGTVGYWEDQIRILAAQVEAMKAEPLNA